MGKVGEIFAIATLPLLLILLVTDIVALNEKFYEKKFQEYNVYQTIDAPKESIDAQAKNIMAFIQSRAPLQGVLLNEKEQVHLQDVQRLVARGHQVLMVVVLLHLVLWMHIRKKKRVVLYGSLLALASMALLYTMPFEQAFLQFHHVAFSNDFWLLNPGTDNLIKMYPIALFQDAGARIGYSVAVVALCGVAVGLYKQKKSSQ